MGYGYSIDLRNRVVNAWHNGEGTYEELAERYGLGRATVCRWLRKKRETGSVEPKPVGGGHPTVFDEEGLIVLEALVQAHPDATLRELQGYWVESGGRATSQSAIHRALKKMSYTVKKKSFIYDERTTEEVEAERTAFLDEVSRIPVEDLVFIDESGVNTNMVRRNARAIRGERAVGTRPSRRGRNITAVAAVNLMSGVFAERTQIGGMNTETFLDWLTEVLLPEIGTGAVVVMDNLRVHHAAVVKESVEAAGCRLLYLPRYSPDLNPIEMAWSKMKSFLRGRAERTTSRVQMAVHDAIKTIERSDAFGWFWKSGYS